MILYLLIANCLHGVVALIWLTGLRRFAGPLCPTSEVKLVALAIVLPVVVAGVGAFGGHVPGTVVRAHEWADALASSHPLVRGSLSMLLVGTAAIFLYQEAVPTWRHKRQRWQARRSHDPRIDAALQRVSRLFQEHGLFPRWGRLPGGARLDSTLPIAGLVGIKEPTVLVSGALLKQVDDDQLDAVIAHELAHSLAGGNLKLLLVWLLRSLQALSPAALILHRRFVQLQEEACDAIAARITARPMALAEVLLLVAKQGGRPKASTTTGSPNVTEYGLRGDQSSTHLRVRGLLDRNIEATDARSFVLVAGLALAGLLWSVG